MRHRHDIASKSHGLLLTLWQDEGGGLLCFCFFFKILFILFLEREEGREKERERNRSVVSCKLPDQGVKPASQARALTRT